MRRFPAVLLAAFAIVGTANAQQPIQTITLNHTTKTQTPLARLALYKNQLFDVVIADTDTNCYNYNGAPKPAPPPPRSPVGATTGTAVVIPVIHDGETTDYLFEIKKKNPFPTGCDANLGRYGEYAWTIRVETYRWTIGFAGAFTVDNLTDPVFSLKPAQQMVNNAPVDGFTIQEERDSKDAVRPGAAVMVHLYHTDPDLLGKKGISWAPLSFGIGVGETTKVRYFFGTSIKFDEQLFVTAGGAFGPVARLPNGVSVGDFTTNANAIQTLASRTQGGFFVSLSYTFMDVNRGPFSSPFKQAAPQ